MKTVQIYPLHWLDRFWAVFSCHISMFPYLIRSKYHVHVFVYISSYIHGLETEAICLIFSRKKGRYRLGHRNRWAGTTLRLSLTPLGSDFQSLSLPLWISGLGRGGQRASAGAGCCLGKSSPGAGGAVICREPDRYWHPLGGKEENERRSGLCQFVAYAWSNTNTVHVHDHYAKFAYGNKSLMWRVNRPKTGPNIGRGWFWTGFVI